MALDDRGDELTELGADGIGALEAIAIVNGVAGGDRSGIVAARTRGIDRRRAVAVNGTRLRIEREGVRLARKQRRLEARRQRQLRGGAERRDLRDRRVELLLRRLVLDRVVALARLVVHRSELED